MKCDECGESVIFCYDCGKPLKQRFYCYEGIDENGSSYNYHFCSQRCWIQCFDYALVKTVGVKGK